MRFVLTNTVGNAATKHLHPPALSRTLRLGSFTLPPNSTQVLARSAIDGDLAAQLVTWLLQGAIRVAIRGVAGFLDERQARQHLGVHAPVAAPLVRRLVSNIAVSEQPTLIRRLADGISDTIQDRLAAGAAPAPAESATAPVEATLPPSEIPSDEVVLDRLEAITAALPPVEPVVPARVRVSVDGMTYDQLLQTVKDLGLSTPSKKKADLIAALEAFNAEGA